MRNVRKPHLQVGRDRPVDRGRRRHGHSLRTALNEAELLASRDMQIEKEAEHAIYPT
jgi:hypothetical protein